MLVKSVAYVQILLLAAVMPCRPAGAEQKEETISGYAEWRIDDVIVVDGQRVRPGRNARFEGKDEVRDYGSIPLGWEVEAKGVRLADGTLSAKEIKAKPNGAAWFEKDVIEATNEAEKGFLEAGRVLLPAGPGRVEDVGILVDEGPDYERVRTMVDRLLPPYLEPSDFRVYVVENDSWNAFAMGNFSIYVHTALINDMDDDELAIIVGHELAHVTHEHSRRQAKKAMWAGMIGAAALVAIEEIDNPAARGAVAALAGLGHMAWINGYSRDLEDQADRVGLRYTYAGGYDVIKGPGLWRKFAARYPDQDRFVNFFFGGHPQSLARARNLDQQIALNYRDSDPRRPYLAEQTAPPEPAEGLAIAPRPAESESASSGGRNLAAPTQPSAAGSRQLNIEPGMIFLEVLEELGKPLGESTSEEKILWRYGDFIVVFEEGRVVEIQFL